MRTIALKMAYLPAHQVVLLQLLPIVVVLLPLFEAVGLTIYWRRSLSSPWLYGLLGVVLAYIVAIGVVFVSEKLKPNRGTVITSSDPVWRNDRDTPRQAPAPGARQPIAGPTFQPLTPSWFGLLAAMLIACGLALWALTFPFRSTTP